MFKKNKSKGFTLIELLVVISIISVLSSTLMVAINGARAKARDAKRISDMIQIRNAIQLYASNNSGKFPGITYVNGVPQASSDSSAAGWTSLGPLLVPQYISSLASDPLPFASNQNYYAFAYVPASWGWDSQFTGTFDSCTNKFVLFVYPGEGKMTHRECKGPSINYVLQ